MANDCLVTKLKGIVSNNNLEKLGYMTIEQRIDNVRYQNKFRYDGAVIFECINCTYNGERTISIPVSYTATTILNSNFVLDAGETVAKYRIPVTNGNRIYIMQLYTPQVFNCDKLQYPNFRLTTFGLYDLGWVLSGDTTKIADLGIKIILQGISATDGETLDITDFGNDSKSWCFDFANSGNKIVGSLNNTGKKIVVGTSSIAVPNSLNVSIDIDVFVRNAVNAGVTTKSLPMGVMRALTIKFNGNAVTGTYNDTISWEPAGEGQTQVSFNGTVLGTISNTI